MLLPALLGNLVPQLITDPDDRIASLERARVRKYGFLLVCLALFLVFSSFNYSSDYSSNLNNLVSFYLKRDSLVVIDNHDYAHFVFYESMKVYFSILYQVYFLDYLQRCRDYTITDEVRISICTCSSLP